MSLEPTASVSRAGSIPSQRACRCATAHSAVTCRTCLPLANLFTDCRTSYIFIPSLVTVRPRGIHRDSRSQSQMSDVPTRMSFGNVPYSLTNLHIDSRALDRSVCLRPVNAECCRFVTERKYSIAMWVTERKATSGGRSALQPQRHPPPGQVHRICDLCPNHDTSLTLTKR